MECLNFYYDNFFILNFGMIEEENATIESIEDFFMASKKV